MNNIFAKRRARLLAMKAIRDSYVPGDQLVACPKCGGESQRKDVAGNLSVCPLCGYHFPIGAYYRLSTILDPGSFRELNEKLPAADPLSFPGYREKQRLAQRKTGLTEAAVTATGSPPGAMIHWLAMYRFLIPLTTPLTRKDFTPFLVMKPIYAPWYALQYCS